VVKIRAALGALVAMMTMAGAAPAAAQTDKPVEVMVLGTWHFNNPGLDLYNAKADDVTTARRQAELKHLADALATFRPTKVMVERIAKTPDLVDDGYAAFTPADLATKKNEAVQIGYRVARQMNLPRVHAIDLQGPFPWGKVQDYAKANGRAERLDATMAPVAAAMKEFERKQPGSTLAALLVDFNRPEEFHSSISSYYDILQFGDPKEQPGAELNAAWYLRNARIWTNLMTVAEPGDRILVVYGAGHNYWLRHFAAETPGFRNVDPVPLLNEAAARR
jgi:hypothetical protein